jgi:hypothetical protein
MSRAWCSKTIVFTEAVLQIWYSLNSVSKPVVPKREIKLDIVKQEGHDGPEVAHLYKGTRSGTSLTPGFLFEQTWKTTIRRCFTMLSFTTHI